MAFYVIGMSEGKIHWPSNYGEFGDGIYVGHGPAKQGWLKLGIPVMARWAVEREVKRNNGHLTKFKYVIRSMWFIRWTTDGVSYKAVVLRR